MKDLVPPQGTVTIDPDQGSDYLDIADNEEVVDTQEPEAAQEPGLTEQQAAVLMQTLHEEQNLMMGGLTGLFAAMVGAGIWAAVTVATEYQIGWMAVGIGFLVGYAVRLAGKGIAPAFGAVSAALSLLGCAAGNLLTFTWFIASAEGLSFMEVATQLNVGIAIEILTSTFEAMDVLFYGLAAYFGYKTAFRQVTQADLDRALGKGF
jgi:hypothetical protein